MDGIQDTGLNERLAVIIPARNEDLLQRTIEDVLENATGDIEVIAVLDGYEADPPLKLHPNLKVIHNRRSIGQRQSINKAARETDAKYIMKLDAHCAVAKGFDEVLKRDCRYEWTMVPRMHNLDVATWKPKMHKRTDYMFISSPSCKKPFRAFYYGRFEGLVTEKIKSDKMIDETMCCMGPGWFMWRDRFWELEGCDEGHGGWGQQGVEVACKAWLSGGALMVNKHTWFAHWFRGGGVPDGFKSGFPYKIHFSDQEAARKYSRDLWMNNKWHLRKRDFSWLISKFRPPTWDLLPELPKRECELSVIIPSYKDPLLHKTIGSILDNFEGDFEVIPVLDGYSLEQPIVDDPRVKPIYLEKNVGMREAINIGVAAARGIWLMRSDEHCMFCSGFDKILLKDAQEDTITSATRYFLDPVKWQVMDIPPINYEKFHVKDAPEFKKFTAVAWEARTRERKEVPVDENMALQGSMWLMHHEWWHNVIGKLQSDGYGTHYQDTTEMLFKTWGKGGRLMLNKNAWYAHRHRSFNRSHQYSLSKAIPGWNYALLKHWNQYLEVKQAWGT